MQYCNEISETDWQKCVLINCWTHQSLDTIEPSDQSAVNNWWWLSRWRVPLLNLVRTNSVRRWSPLLLSLHVRVKNWPKSMHLCQIQHKFRCSEYLCKLGKEYLNALTCKFYSFTRQNSATFDVSHAFLPLTVAKLSTPNNSPFLTHLYWIGYIWSPPSGYVWMIVAWQQCGCSCHCSSNLS